MANPLDGVLAWHQTATDGLRVTRRVLRQRIAGAITDKHVFHAQPTVAASLALLNSAQVELDRVVVLGLAAVFERTLRDHLTGFIATREWSTKAEPYNIHDAP